MRVYELSDDQLEEFSNWVIVERDIDLVRGGDTVLCRDGEVRTVSNCDINNDSFMGRSIFGDTWNSGSIKVICLEVKKLM